MQKRNYGIDLLRIVATLMIIVLHILGAGGVLRSVEPDSINYKVAWLIEIAAYCAVNCYALISGYVGIHSNFRVSNIVKLWLQVALYTVAFYCIGAIWIESITWKTVIKACFPVMTKEYWYFSAYFALYLLMPFLNMILHAVDEKMAKWLVIVCMGLFVCMPVVTQNDLFFMNSGYCVAWLIILYLVGGVMQKYDAKLSKKKGMLFVGYISVVLLTFIAQIVDVPIFDRGFLMSYNSPTMVIAAVCLVLLFKELNVIRVAKGIKIFHQLHLGYI